MSKICGGSWHITAAARPALHFVASAVGSRESTSLMVSAMSRSSGARSPCEKRSRRSVEFSCRGEGGRAAEHHDGEQRRIRGEFRSPCRRCLRPAPGRGATRSSLQHRQDVLDRGAGKPRAGRRSAGRRCRIYRAWPARSSDTRRSPARSADRRRRARWNAGIRDGAPRIPARNRSRTSRRTDRSGVMPSASRIAARSSAA